MHKCEPDYASNKINFDAYGVAINYCHENNEGEFWVTNGEYASRVNFCPYCGEKAPKQINKP